MQCKKGSLINIRHNDVPDDWGNLCASAIRPSDVSHEPLIKYVGQRTVTGATAAEPEEEDTKRF